MGKKKAANRVGKDDSAAHVPSKPTAQPSGKAAATAIKVRAAAAAAAGSSPAKTRAKDEIDGIFSSKKHKQLTGPLAVAAEDNPAATPADKKAAKVSHAGQKRAKDEIDDIFSTKKQQNAGNDAKGQAAEPEPGLQEVAKQVADARHKVLQQKPKIVGSKDDIFGESTGKARKCTEEGYAVYDEDELGLNTKGGDTELCPFDCDCCF
eukprot:GHRR01006303.1.p1 GENE.GHRR01006303.1~~GHRR01006303.1.p1  ORF type:complete len:207 (+),score=78.98 GHRR01006303.1:3194-3814(+)